MRNKIRFFLLSHISPGAALTAAVSGGKDSMALLHALLSLSQELSFTLRAAHFHHGLRDGEADRDRDFVAEYCSAHGISCALGEGNVKAYAQEHGLGDEEAARILRYSYLTKAAGDGYLLTAHTAEDNLETVLMHLLRGTGLHGLTGIPPVRGKILRPMLDVTRQEIDTYLTEFEIPHVEDSSNQSDQYLRNRLRHQVLPVLLRENPMAALHTTQMCQSLQAEDNYLQAQARLALEEISSEGALDRDALLSLPEALEYRVLGLYLHQIPSLSRGHFDRVLDFCRSPAPSGVLELPDGFSLRRVYRQITIERICKRTEASPGPMSITPGQAVTFGPWRVSCRLGRSTESPDEMAIPAGCLEKGLTLRVRQPGDRIQLSGGTRKLSRLMIDLKIPAHWRNTLPVLWAGNAIAAALPFQASAAFAVKENEECVIFTAERTED